MRPLFTIPSLASRCIRLLSLWRRSGWQHARLASLRPPFHISARRRHACVWSDGGSSAKTCYREVVVEDCYRIFSLPSDFRPKQIVDIGANIGTFSMLCSVLFPSARIHAYEPYPAAFLWLEKNAEATRIVAHSCAVAAADGIFKFDPGADSGLGCIATNGTLSVEAIGGSRAGDPGQIDLLKMDCEGGEWAIFSTPELLKRSARLCMEYHLDDGCDLTTLKDRLADGGHEITHLDDQPHSRSGHLTSVRR